MKILNFGSLNMDYVYKVDTFVKPGETMTSKGREVFAGGKGLNQSIALARAGVSVNHAGAIGDDEGSFLIETLDQSGVNTDHIRVIPEVATGHALITVDAKGENSILLHGGANHAISRDHREEVLATFDPGDYLLLQNEINDLEDLIGRAHEKGMKIVLNPSPMTATMKFLDFEKIDLLIMNEIEAQFFCPDAFGERLLPELADRFPTTRVVLTLGAMGSFLIDGEKTIYQRAFPVTPVDTTGAGDTFTGYLLAGMIRGASMEDCLRQAARAASIAVQRPGAEASIPVLEEVLREDAAI